MAVTALDNIQLRLPSFYNKYDENSVLYGVISSFADADESRVRLINRVNDAIGIDTTHDEDLQHRWGDLLSMNKKSDESYTAYRNRLRVAYPSLVGGTESAIRYAIASVIGITNDQELVDNYIKVYDAWEEYTGQDVIRTGTSISINESIGSYADIINVDGTYKQVVTVQGSNIIDVSKLSDVTYVKKGSFRASIWGTTIMTNTQVKRIFKPNTRYYVKCKYTLEVASALPVFSFNVGFNLYSAATGTLTIARSDTLDIVGETANVTFTFITPSDLADKALLFYSNRYTNGTTVELGRALVEDLIISETDVPYSDFVPDSPSPLYPSPIINATNFDMYATRGGNLLENKGVNVVRGGVTYTVNADKTITATGTRTSTSYIELLGSGSGSDIVFTFRGGMTYYSPTVKLSYKQDNGLYSSIDKGASFTPDNDVNCVCIYYEVYSDTILPLTVGCVLTTDPTVTAYQEWMANKISVPYNLGAMSNGVRNTIEVVNGVTKYIKRIDSVTFDGSADENWVTENPKTDTLLFYISGYGKQTGGTVLCNRFPSATGNYHNDIQSVWNTYGLIEFRISRKYLTTQDMAGFKTWLAANPVTVQYELETPVETIIPNMTMVTYEGITDIISTSTPKVSITVAFKDAIYNIIHNVPEEHKAYCNILCIIDLTIGQNASDMEQEIMDAVNIVKASGIKPHILYIGIKLISYDDMSRFNYVSLGGLSYAELAN